MPKIFVSYRRLDSAAYAGRLYDALTRAYGRSSVFLDIDKIRPGDEFNHVLETRIRQSRVFLALIGPGWIGASDEGGRRRIDDPEDFVRLEIGSALEQGLPAIPVLLGGAKMPSADRLPDELKRLPRLHACEVGDVHFWQDVQRLICAIDERLGLPARVSLALFRWRYLVAAMLALSFLVFVVLGPLRGWRVSSPPANVQTGGRSEPVAVQSDTTSPRLNHEPGEPEIDVATMRLKREIDKLSQMRDMLRQSAQSERTIGTIGILLARVPKASGSYVTSLIGEGPADVAGLRAGDIIDALDGKPVGDVNDIELAIMKARPGSTLMVSIRRGARQLAFPVIVDSMGDADISERMAQIEDRYRSLERKREQR